MPVVRECLLDQRNQLVVSLPLSVQVVAEKNFAHGRGLPLVVVELPVYGGNPGRPRLEGVGP